MSMCQLVVLFLALLDTLICRPIIHHAAWQLAHWYIGTL